MYQRINGDDYRQIFIVGDLHGCIDNFWYELERAGFDKDQDIVVSTGDLVDRGPNSLACLDLLTQPWFHAVRGNHEMLMFGALNNEKEDSFYWWRVNGGCWDELLDEEQHRLLHGLIRRIPELPFIIHLQIGKQSVVVAHADYPSNHYEYGKPVDPMAVIWNRSRVANISEGFGSNSIDGADLFVFGHTILKEPLRYHNLMYIDTGVAKTGKLTIVKVK